jgi:Mg-chelatase subunit ChlD
MSQNKALLSEYDFVVVVDASGSMGTADMAGDKSRWTAMQETVGALVREIQELDSDGIDLVVFGGSNVSVESGVTTASLDNAFAARRPMGGTPLAEALTAALKLAGKSDKKDFILVITDGVPDDKAAAAKVIVDASNRLESDDELTFLFVQIGNDASAAAYLKSLDDDLTGAKFDIVDAKTMAEVEQYPSVVDLIVAAIND